MCATPLFALLLLAPGRPDPIPDRPPRPGDRVTLAARDRFGKPAGFLVAVDRETFTACDGHDLGAFLDAWENGEAWHVEGPVRAVLVELPPAEADDDELAEPPPRRRPVVLVRLLGGPYEGLTLAVPREVVTRP